MKTTALVSRNYIVYVYYSETADQESLKRYTSDTGTCFCRDKSPDVPMSEACAEVEKLDSTAWTWKVNSQVTDNEHVFLLRVLL